MRSTNRADGDQERVERYRALLAGHMLRLEAGTHEDRDRVYTRVRALLLKKLTGEMALDGASVARELKAFDVAAREIEAAIQSDDVPEPQREVPARPAPGVAPDRQGPTRPERHANAFEADAAPLEAEDAAPARTQATARRRIALIVALAGILAIVVVGAVLAFVLLPAGSPQENAATPAPASQTERQPARPLAPEPAEGRPSVRVVETLRITPPQAHADQLFTQALAEDGLSPVNAHVIEPGAPDVLSTSEGMNTIEILSDGTLNIARITSQGDVALSSGETDGARVHLPQDRAAAIAGRSIRVYAEVRAAGAPSGEVSLAYSAGALGNSGWQIFALTNEWQVVHFDYAVPAGTREGASDVIAIRSGVGANGVPVDVRMLAVAGRP